MRNWPPPEFLEKSWIAFGLKCCVCRGPGSINGYVHVPLDHPDHGKHYDQVEVSVHGGLTFGEEVLSGTWFGFDTMHAGDWTSFGILGYEHPGRIWTVDDVVLETTCLAEQLAARRP